MLINEKTDEAAICLPEKQAKARVFLDLLHMVFVTWPERRRQRLHLSSLSDHHLSDIGVTRSQARLEAGRWFFE